MTEDAAIHDMVIAARFETRYEKNARTGTCDERVERSGSRDREEIGSVFSTALLQSLCMSGGQRSQEDEPTG